MDPRREVLRGRLSALGFDEVRFAAVTPLVNEGLPLWLADGMHADMDWMQRTAAKRLDPALVLPGARSVIMLGLNYWPGDLPQAEATWARYAVNEDYHDTMKHALNAAGNAVAEVYGATREDYRCYVDTGPVLERSWAARAGVGFVGKNSMLISRRHGNWLILASILTRVDLEPDEPIRRKHSDASVGLLCGKCTRCLDACPTNAFPQPGVVDARRCISYQTIENKGVIPRELRAAIGTRIYGCDVCLEVCPWNRFAQTGRRLLLAARHDLVQLTLAEILQLTPARFAEVFRRTAIKRLKLRGMLRNACIVAGNSGDRTLLPHLVRLAAHELPVVRAHAVWAVRRMDADELLADLRLKETDPIVLEEYGTRSEERKEE
jgi:epoxyqueuosine reductase